MTLWNPEKELKGNTLVFAPLALVCCVESGEGIERKTPARSVAAEAGSVESGEGIERLFKQAINSAAKFLVESGEGIERASW